MLGRVSGNPVFRGTRLPVYSLFENLAGGATTHDFKEWFHPVDESDVKAVLEFVAQDLRTSVPDECMVRCRKAQTLRRRQLGDEAEISVPTR